MNIQFTGLEFALYTLVVIILSVVAMSFKEE